MDIKRLKEIVNSSFPDEVVRVKILDLLSEDESLLPTMLDLLKRERKSKRELISDMNLELSRAHIYIELYPENKKQSKENFNKSFVIEEIGKFYNKYKGVIIHCFNRFK